MKAKVRVWKEIEIEFVVIDIKPRYVGDSEDDDISTDIPLLNEQKEWRVTVEIDTGYIHGWPKGEPREMHVKVCDEGIYTLQDKEGNDLAQIAGYVPNDVVPGSYGDYIELTIDENGVITNWPKNPDISRFFRNSVEEE